MKSKAKEQLSQTNPALPIVIKMWSTVKAGGLKSVEQFEHNLQQLQQFMTMFVVSWEDLGTTDEKAAKLIKLRVLPYVRIYASASKLAPFADTAPHMVEYLLTKHGIARDDKELLKELKGVPLPAAPTTEAVPTKAEAE